MSGRLARLADFVREIAIALGCGAPEQSVDCADRDGVIVATVAGKAAPLEPDHEMFILDLETVFDPIERLAEDARVQVVLSTPCAHATAPWLVQSLHLPLAHRSPST